MLVSREYKAADAVDIFVKGEAEERLNKILDLIKNKRSLFIIDGVIIREKNNYYESAKIKEEGDLNSLPLPNFDGFELNDYAEKTMPIATSRGCPRQCSFCNNSTNINKYRFRNATSVFKEMLISIDKYKSTRFVFCDSMLNGNLVQLEKLCDLIIKHKIRIVWGGYVAILKNMPYALYVKMKKAGCEYVVYGVESFSDKILRAMKKNVTVVDTLKILKFTTKAGINANIHIIVGFPGEEEKDFQQTLKLIKQHRKNYRKIINVDICRILPGSDLYNNPDQYGIVFQSKGIKIKWKTTDGKNTNKIRNIRMKKLVYLIVNEGMVLPRRIGRREG